MEELTPDEARRFLEKRSEARFLESERLLIQQGEARMAAESRALLRYQGPPKNPGIAAVLSALWFGTGQLYNGKITEGIICMLGWPVVVTICMLLGFLVPPLWLVPVGVWAWGVFNAFKGAEKFNRERLELAQERVGA